MNWEKCVSHLDKFNFYLSRNSTHNTNFLALVRVLLTYIWRLLVKCSSSSFYSACGNRGLKQIGKFFYLAKLKERGRSFLKGAEKAGVGQDYPK